jgi:hypothetical protein
MPLLNEKQKLNLKIYIRLLLYVKDKYEKLQNSSKISSSLIEYLKKQIRENKKYNDELRYNQYNALDDTFTTLFIEKRKNIAQGKNIAHILSSISEQDSHEDTKTRMSKVVEELLTSIKKINGMSTLALDWSKNEDVSTRENFSCHIMIINLKTEKWWINNPKNKIDQLTTINKGCKITYNDTIPAGIYFVDKKFCKTYIRLSKNNKTNKLITTIFVYLMLKRSISLKMFITLPASNNVLKFNILNAFS